MKSLHLFLLLSTLLVIGCQTDPKPKQAEPIIFSSYYVRYMEPERELKAEATFRQGDSQQNAQAKQFNSVTFNNKEMVFKELSANNKRYIFNASMDFSSDDLQFGFINDAGQKESQPFSFSPITKLSVQGTINKSKGAAISWEGGPLTAEESVVCLFDNAANKSTSLIIKGPSNGSQINIPPEKMNGLTPGTAELYLVRKKRIRKESGKRISFAQMEYYTKTIEVVVE